MKSSLISLANSYLRARAIAAILRFEIPASIESACLLPMSQATGPHCPLRGPRRPGRSSTPDMLSPPELSSRSRPPSSTGLLCLFAPPTVDLLSSQFSRRVDLALLTAIQRISRSITIVGKRHFNLG